MRYFFTEFIPKCLLLMAVMFVGNYLGDQKTIKDCATSGNATMLGGGRITCEVTRS